jgi:hypothetical protein
VVVVIKVVMELLVELLMNCVIDEEEGGRGRGERRMKFHMYTARTGSERERERAVSFLGCAPETHTHRLNARPQVGMETLSFIIIHRRHLRSKLLEGKSCYCAVLVVYGLL